jgi:predicted dehydrogenase
LERLNELEYYNCDAPAPERGFRTILVTDAAHPYLKAWWPAGHIIGWEHTFIHEIGDFLTAIASGEPIHADFGDGLRCQLVLDAAVLSAREGRWVDVPEK